MARQLRLEYSDAYYHVMNRGAGRKRVFHDEVFYNLFIELLEEICQRFKIQIHSYCVMGNHYHLLLKTRYKNLSRSMRHLNSVFTMRHHRLTGKDGALFRGRFKSILVDSENYLLQVSRYIHLNPVEAGLVQMPADYSWSSYKDYCFPKNKPNWLTVNEILSRFNGKRKTIHYQEFTNEGIDEETQKIYQAFQKPPVIGNDSFCQQIKNQLKLTPKIEVPATKLLSSRYIAKSKIIEALSNHYNISDQAIMLGKNKHLKKLAIYFCCQLAKDTHTELGIFFSANHAAISQTYRRIKEALKTSNTLNKEISQIEKILSNVEI